MVSSRFFFFQAEDGIRDFCLSRGLGDVYKRQQKGVVTTELDLKKLSQDIATLRKNRENVPLELLKTKYKKPYAKLKEEIRAQFEIYVKHLIMLGILKTGPDLTGAKAQSMVDQIQKIIDEEKEAGHQKEVTHAVFEAVSYTHLTLPTNREV